MTLGFDRQSTNVRSGGEGQGWKVRPFQNEVSFILTRDGAGNSVDGPSGLSAG